MEVIVELDVVVGDGHVIRRWCRVSVVEYRMLASAEVRRAERVALKCIAKSLSDARQSSGLTALWMLAAVGAE